MTDPSYITLDAALQFITSKVRSGALNIPKDPKSANKVHDSLTSLIEAVGFACNKAQAREEDLVTEEGDLLVGMEHKTPGVTSGIIGFRQDLESCYLRFLSLILPIERFMKHDEARAARADPIANKDKIYRVIALYDERSLQRIQRMKWTRDIPNRVAALLEHWPEVEAALRQYLHQGRTPAQKD